jgi:hypothetical protein
MVGESITVKYGQIEAIRNVVMKLFKQSIPVDVQYWLNRNVVSLAQATQPLEEERFALIKEIGIYQQDSDAYLIDPENERIKELMNREINITINKIDVNKMTKANLTQAELHVIKFMLCEEQLIKVASQIMQ